MKKRRKNSGLEVVSTLTVQEAAAKPQPHPPATQHPARASSQRGSRSMGMVRTGQHATCCNQRDSHVGVDKLAVFIV